VEGCLFDCQADYFCLEDYGALDYATMIVEMIVVALVLAVVWVPAAVLVVVFVADVYAVQHDQAILN
jgi:hypothetical protein